jgi:hypothetical protein
VQKRRLARLLLVAFLATGSAGALTACGGGAKAGDGVMSPPSTSK